jgi:hypothetical protein
MDSGNHIVSEFFFWGHTGILSKKIWTDSPEVLKQMEERQGVSLKSR